MERWSTKEGSKDPKHYVQLTCSNCGKRFSRIQGSINKALRENPNQARWFCGVECINTNLSNRNRSPETIARNRDVQLGVSVPSRGRLGHIVSAETREKIRLAKIGVSVKSDHDIIIKELVHRGTPRYAITKNIIPDAIFIEDGRLVALEVEKKKWETDIKKKMKVYANSTDYDKVVIVWYSPKGERLKEWHKDNGKWILVPS